MRTEGWERSRQLQGGMGSVLATQGQAVGRVGGGGDWLLLEGDEGAAGTVIVYSRWLSRWQRASSAPVEEVMVQWEELGGKLRPRPACCRLATETRFLLAEGRQMPSILPAGSQGKGRVDRPSQGTKKDLSAPTKLRGEGKGRKSVV